MARVIHYEDLVLAIEPDGEDSYRVRALSSPYGLTAAPFALPFRRQELEGLIQEVGVGVLQSTIGSLQPARHLVPPELGDEPAPNLPEAGARLFQALFHETVR